MTDPKVREDLANLLNDLGLTGLAVEIGVHRGEFSCPFLDRWKGDALYLVDPWRTLDEYTDPINQGDRAADLFACMEAIKPHAGRFSVWEMDSVDACRRFLDETFDFVYIDANHEEAFVRQDLSIWWPKVKPGGIMAGHDYLSTVTWPGVQAAWNEFCNAAGLIPKLTWETGGSVWVRKPEEELCPTLA